MRGAVSGAGLLRWQEMLASLAALLPEASRCVLVDGPPEQAQLFAARLIAKLAECGHPAWATADPALTSDLRVYLRTAGPWPAGDHASLP